MLVFFHILVLVIAVCGVLSALVIAFMILETPLSPTKVKFQSGLIGITCLVTNYFSIRIDPKYYLDGPDILIPPGVFVSVILSTAVLFSAIDLVLLFTGNYIDKSSSS